MPQLSKSRKMNSDEEDDIVHPENLPVYRKGKEILDMGLKENPEE